MTFALDDPRVQQMADLERRLRDDLPQRIIGFTLGSLVASLVLPLWQTALILLAMLAAELLQAMAYRSFNDRRSRAAYIAVFVLSSFGFVAFVALPLLLWQEGSETVRLASTLYIFGALLHVSAVRSNHLWNSLANAVAPMLTLAYFVTSVALEAEDPWSAALAVTALFIIAGYFGTMLLVNHHAQNNLAQARISAQAANAAKSRFLSSMSHEMLTPLNLVLGLSSLVKADASGDTQRAARDIESAARSLRRMIEDLLDVAEADATVPAARPITVQPRRELEETLAAEQRISDDLRISLDTSLAQRVRLDPYLLRRTLHQLIRHIRSQTGQDPRLHVTGRAETGRIIVTLTTDDPAARASTRKPHVAERLAQALDARIIKTDMGWELAVPTQPLPALPTTEENPLGQGRRVLVVDDIATNRLVVSAILAKLGIATLEAESGAEALAVLGREAVDAVLLDMNMPGMDGMATFRAIRTSSAAFASVPVLAVTANTLREHRDAYLEAGFDGYVPKPVERVHLWAELVSALTPQVGVSQRKAI